MVMLSLPVILLGIIVIEQLVVIIMLTRGYLGQDFTMRDCHA